MSSLIRVRFNRNPTKRIAKTTSRCWVCRDSIHPGEVILGVGLHRDVDKNEWIHEKCLATLKSQITIVFRTAKSTVADVPKNILPEDVLDVLEGKTNTEQAELSL
jgi:hypothetical protein